MMIEQGDLPPAILSALRASQYLGARRLPSGEIAAVARFLFTFDLLLGCDETGYRTRFSYESMHDALEALLAWDGAGDPPGPWIKEKGRGERDNPRRPPPD